MLCVEFSVWSWSAMRVTSARCKLKKIRVVEGCSSPRRRRRRRRCGEVLFLFLFFCRFPLSFSLLCLRLARVVRAPFTHARTHALMASLQRLMTLRCGRHAHSFVPPAPLPAGSHARGRTDLRTTHKHAHTQTHTVQCRRHAYMHIYILYVVQAHIRTHTHASNPMHTKW